MGGGEQRNGTERLALRLDHGSSLFLFGYYLRALEDSAPDRSADDLLRTRRLLEQLLETASRTAGLEPLCAEVADVARLVDERTRDSGRMEDGLAALLGGCARRWFQRVREMPKRRNSLAVDIAFKIELAGLEDIAADLYEAIVCIEAGAYRASRSMSRRALEKALGTSGMTGADLGTRLRRAKEAGLVTASDVRSALANLCDAEVFEGNGEGDDDGSLAEWALETAHRLAKRLLRRAIEERLLSATYRAAGTPAPPCR